MSAVRFSCFAITIAFLVASCGEPERPKPAAISVNARRGGGQFDEIGKVSLYPGESCASQIMFVFHSGRSTSISLAAPMRQSKILTDAARERRTVRVMGKWRRGKVPDCSYVEATQVEVQKSFW